MEVRRSVMEGWELGVVLCETASLSQTQVNQKTSLFMINLYRETGQLKGEASMSVPPSAKAGWVVGFYSLASCLHTQTHTKSISPKRGWVPVESGSALTGFCLIFSQGGWPYFMQHLQRDISRRWA